jgi:hypothetical protein
MAIRGVSLSEREEVILPHDPGHPEHPEYKKAIKQGRNPDEPTKFFVGNLTKGCRIELGDMTTSPTMKDGGVTMELRRTKRAYAVVQRALHGWENMTDHKGKPIAFVSGTVQTPHGFVAGASDETMMQLGADDIDALSKFILEKNGMTRQAEGNFGAQSLPFGGTPSENGDATTALTDSAVSEDAQEPPKSRRAKS